MGTTVYDSPNYIVDGDMSDDVAGPWFRPQVNGEELFEVDWGATDAPTGSLLLQYTQEDAETPDTARIFTVPGVTFSASPAGTAGSVQQRFPGLRVYKRLRVFYDRSGGGTANTSLNIRRYSI
jgi:hypothetical protein